MTVAIFPYMHKIILKNTYIYMPPIAYMTK